MQLPPPEILLTWPTANYVDPTDVRGKGLLIATWICFPLSVLMVALRIFTRLQISKSFGIDDAFLLLAMASASACAILVTLGVTRWGYDRHIWDVPLDLIIFGLKLSIIMSCFFGVAVTCTKISLLIWMRRLMPDGMLRHIALLVVVVVACVGITFEIIVIFKCTPVSAYWTLSVTPQKCIDDRTHLLTTGIISTVTNFIVLTLPLLAVLRLKIPRRQQILLSFVFGLGFLACIAGTCRVWFVFQAKSTYDRTWISYPILIASQIELDVGITCAAILALRPFFLRYFPGLLSSAYPDSVPSQISSMSHELGRISKERASDSTEIREIFPASESYHIQELPPALKAKPSTRISVQQISPWSYYDHDKFLQDQRTQRKTRLTPYGATPMFSIFNDSDASIAEQGRTDQAASASSFV